MSNVVFAETLNDAASLVNKIDDIDDKLILRNVPPKDQQSWRSSPNVGLGKIEVRSFSFNHLKLEADVLKESGAWLYYADADHPGWQARINGKKTDIAEANLAFKAVRLEQGKNTVEFTFFDGLKGWDSIFLALFGVTLTTSLFWFTAKKLRLES